MATHQQTYNGWKKAVKSKYSTIGSIGFYGDKDIGGAQLLDSSGKAIAQIGEWDGAIGEVFNVVVK